MVSQRDFVATTPPQALSLGWQTAQATVSKRYQPVAIAATVAAYTMVHRRRRATLHLNERFRPGRRPVRAGVPAYSRCAAESGGAC